MSISSFNVVESYVGDGANDTYTFDFYVESASYLRIKVWDTDDELVEDILGTDVVFLDSITLNSTGGTIVLTDDLPSGYTMKIFLANDAVTQPYEFRNKFDFTLKRVENAFDFVVRSIQRVSYLAQRAIRLNELDTLADFDMSMPPDAAGNAGKTLGINADGDGFAYNISGAEILQAVSDAEDAQAAAETAQAAAEVAQAAAEAAQTAAELAETNAELAEVGAEASEIAAAASAAAAAAAASGAIPDITGTRASPSAIVAGTGIAFTGNSYVNIWFVEGSGGAVDISADPQIAAGNIIGQRLILIGRSDTNTVKLEHGTGLSLSGGSGEIYLFADSIVEFMWDGTNWVQTGI